MKGYGRLKLTTSSLNKLSPKFYSKGGEIQRLICESDDRPIRSKKQNSLRRSPPPQATDHFLSARAATLTATLAQILPPQSLCSAGHASVLDSAPVTGSASCQCHSATFCGRTLPSRTVATGKSALEKDRHPRYGKNKNNLSGSTRSIIPWELPTEPNHFILDLLLFLHTPSYILSYSIPPLVKGLTPLLRNYVLLYCH